jgi:hypothetical protein
MDEASVSRNRGLRNRQIDFSLVQLRLVGLLIIVQLIGRLVVALPGMMQSSPLERLSAVLILANWLPLLPLGISLYLLGAGHQRHPREQTIIPVLCQALRPLALVFTGLIPAALAWSVKAAKQVASVQDLTPYQQELLSPERAITAIVLSVLTGLAFLMLDRQMKAMFKRYQMTLQLFFRSRRVRLKTGSRV